MSGTTKDNFKLYLKEQIDFLSRSADSYDEGYTHEAKRLAVVIRVLLHDTPHSISLLKRLNKKDIHFYDTANEYDPMNLAPTMGLVFLMSGPDGANYIPPLDDNMRPQNRKVPFAQWWDKIVIADNQGNKLTRRNVILDVANKEGGAHVDPKLNKEYANLIKDNTLGLKYIHGTEEGDMGGIELASIRQIAYEVLKSLEDEFPEHFKEDI